MMKLIPIITCLLLQGCGTPQSFLTGTWEFDGDRTLVELNKEVNVPPRLLKCFELRACGHGSVFIYTDESWSHYFKFSPDKVYGPVPYKQEIINSKVYRISTTAQEKPQVFNVHQVNETTLYMELEYDGFTYNEYLKKIH